MGGKAYEHATSAFLGMLPEAAREQVKDVFSKSLRQTWLVSLAFAGMGLLAAFLAREVPMRSELDTQYGMEERKPKKTSDA
jgi:hypothetical protein